MKKVLFTVVCVLLAGTLLAQEKYPIPVRTADQKHGRALWQYYWIQAANIHFAKEHGVMPYEYGKYIGNLAAPTWGPGNDFDGLLKGVVNNWECFRHSSDAPFIVKENEDGSVNIIGDDMMRKYFPEGKALVSYDEFKEYMLGSFEPIANHMGAVVTIETRDTLLVFSFRKK